MKGTDGPSILVIEDDEAMREVLAYNAREVSERVSTAPDGKSGLLAFERDRHDIVLTDLKMPGVDGMTVLREVLKKSPDTVVIVVTAFGDVPTAVEAMKAGAYDFVEKPFERERLRVVLRKAAEVAELRKRVSRLERTLAWGEREIVFASQAMKRTVEIADRVAKTDAPVLLVGESGTGKELLARRIHARSARARHPFVAVNCGALPRELLESELFGHVKGAFTGAIREHKGKFQQADKGTLLLDEIGELPLDLQPKLLRVLEDGVVPVLGSERGKEVDVRVVAATNRDLKKECAEGRFREDLYYRLAVVTIRVPPLRERQKDVKVLVAHFLNKWGEGRRLHLGDRAMQMLLEARWPGNVRQLENVCRRLCIFASDDEVSPELVEEALREEGLLDELAGADNGEAAKPRGLREMEREAIEAALRQAHGNQSEAARILGIPRHVLLYRMKKYGIAWPSRRGDRGNGK